MIVDTHCHASLDWYEPVETLLFQMDRNGVERAVLIQILGQTANAYQQACVRRYPDRFASVVLVDAARADAAGQLEQLAGEGACGVRLRAGTRSPGDDPLAIWRAAERLGLAVSCPGSSAEFAAEDFAHVVQGVPRLPIVLEHLAAANRPDADESEARARRAAFELARYPNVYIKVHGVGEIARRAMPVRSGFPFEQPVPRLLEAAFEAFGPDRMMWGSDFPPVAGREGYTGALRFCREQFSRRSAAAIDAIFGGTALSVFFAAR